MFSCLGFTTSRSLQRNCFLAEKDESRIVSSDYLVEGTESLSLRELVRLVKEQCQTVSFGRTLIYCGRAQQMRMRNPCSIMAHVGMSFATGLRVRFTRR